MTALVVEESRYERLERIAWWDQARLSEARLLVAGAGALGNEILKNLALLGAGRLVIVDFDAIELSNLSRSVLYRAGDQDRMKAATAAERLREINPDLRVLPIVGDLRWDVGLGLLRRMQVVLAGLDSIGARLVLNQMCWRVGVPWIDGAIDELSGMVRTYLPPAGACFECNLSEEDFQRLSARYSCHLLPREAMIEGSVPTTPTSASMVAAWQVQEAVKWLHGLPVAGSRGVSYDGLENALYKLRFERRADCLAHDVMDQVISLRDTSCEQTVGELLASLKEHFGTSVTVELDREIALGSGCPACGQRQLLLAPHHTLRSRETRCRRCGGEVSLELTHRLDGQRCLREIRLRQLGIPALHILTARNPDGQPIHFELGGDAERGALADFLRGRHDGNP